MNILYVNYFRINFISEIIYISFYLTFYLTLTDVDCDSCTEGRGPSFFNWYTELPIQSCLSSRL